ncbi:winged helix-turn-helix domain-containing protein [Wenzhouxiangella sp. AB-CW3]|uniref:winged helix-turn-helix domain-containing protein n=1 Tax=Wenzhouxiangella sp. AB-CW3 TaxID=2771012 RepID=UPI00168BB21F|nr:winged helix-turn-helix domain-containing protein [Wenzhouxiangella sp. AB-CW3]QOC23010.1 winged helix-turn-helix domain-containing protein [Wenzhouxiangella sp. AB-CW3]
MSDLERGFQLEDWEVHPQQNLLTGPAGEAHLTPRCMDVLALLAKRAGEVVDRDEFSVSIWHPVIVSDATLTRHISMLRKLLGDETDQPRFIETIPKRGYRLVATVRPLPAAPDQEQAEPAAPHAPGDRTLHAQRRTRLPALLVLLLALGVAGMLTFLPREAEIEAPLSIAVLPFEAFGVEHEEVLTDGLHHDLLTRLSLIDELRVISRTSVKRYRDSVLPITEIAAELGVQWVVEGAVQREGDEIQVNAQLIDGASDTHIWARTYRHDLNAENLFAIQTDIVEDIAASLAPKLSTAEKEQDHTAPTRNLAAYTLTHQGQAYLRAQDEEAAEQALAFFRKAIEQDPDYALAWVGLANALGTLHDYGYRPLEEVKPEAEAAIQRAKELDPNLPEVHVSLAGLYAARGNRPKANRFLRRAITLGPSHAKAHSHLSWNYQLTGMTVEALDSARKAVELDPFSQEAQTNLVGALMANGRYPEALQQARDMEAQALPYLDNFYKGLVLYFKGRYRDAIGTLEPMEVAWAGGGTRAVRALAHVELGERQQAQALHDELLELDYHFSAGLVLAALGEIEAAFATFDQIEQWGHWPALAMNLYGDVLIPDELLDDARFEALQSDLWQQQGLDDASHLPEA